MEATQAKFEGWAVVEMMGHQREIGYVTTEYYGTACMFRVDTPEIPEREAELKRPEWLDTDKGYRVYPTGTKVRREAIPAKSRLVAPSALYAMNPCTEETARKAIEDSVPRKLILLHIPEPTTPALNPAPDDVVLPEEEIDDDVQMSYDGAEDDDYNDEASAIRPR